MGNYDELKQAVSDVIKTNGNQEITGQLLQNTLLSIISTIGANATFAGIATPETNPGTPDQNIFYIATEEGNYVNFGIATVQKNEFAILSINSSGNWINNKFTILNDLALVINSDNPKVSEYVPQIIVVGDFLNSDVFRFDVGKDDNIGYYFILYKNGDIVANYYGFQKYEGEVLKLNQFRNSGMTAYLCINQKQYALFTENNVYKGLLYNNKLYDNVYNGYLKNILETKISLDNNKGTEIVKDLYIENGDFDSTYYFDIGRQVESSNIGYYLIAYKIINGVGRIIGNYYSKEISYFEEYVTLYKQNGANETISLYFDLSMFEQFNYGEEYRFFINNIAALSLKNQQRLSNFLYFKSIDIEKKLLPENIIFEGGKYIDYSTGVETPISTVDVGSTDFLPISEDIEYYYTGREFQDVTAWAFYDKQKKWISSKKTSQDQNNLYAQIKVDNIPTNAAFIRFSYYFRDWSDVAYVSARSKAKPLPFVGIKWALIGDSLTEYNLRAKKHYFDYISEKTGISIFNYGVSGSGYMARQSEDKAFYQRIPLIEENIDLYTIFGSGNDTRETPLGNITDTGTESVCGCINTTIDAIYQRNPIAKIGIITPTPWKDRTPSDDGNILMQYTDLLAQICKRRSIPCLNLYYESLLNPNSEEVRALAYSRDGDTGVHPDEVGQKLFAPQILEFIKRIMI